MGVSASPRSPHCANAWQKSATVFSRMGSADDPATAMQGLVRVQHHIRVAIYLIVLRSGRVRPSIQVPGTNFLVPGSNIVKTKK